MEPEYIDIHAHVNFSAFELDAAEVLNRALENKIWLINIGSQEETSQRALELADKYPQGVYACVGHHPIHAFEEKNSFSIDNYRQLLKNDKVVGVGECGLDYFRVADKEKQRKVFSEQLALAEEFSLPVMVHIREAFEDVLAILQDFPNLRVNAHFFSGDWSMARRFLDRDYTLSFTGVITFASQYDEIVKNCPLKSIMSETDCPYVSPWPERGKRNEPLNVRLVAERIAELRSEPREEVLQALVSNARRIFSF